MIDDKPRYGSLTVSDDLTLNFDMDDTWIAIKSSWSDECDCIMIGLSELDSLIEKLSEARTALGVNSV